jgi:mycothiol system anti-sigma-R factor
MSGESMISCREAVEKLWPYIDGEVTAEEASAIRAHLHACGCCHPHFDFQKAFCNLVGQLARSHAPPDLRKQILACLLAEEQRLAEGGAAGRERSDE